MARIFNFFLHSFAHNARATMSLGNNYLICNTRVTESIFIVVLKQSLFTSSYSVPGTVLGTGDAVMKKRDKIPAHMGFLS